MDVRVGLLGPFELAVGGRTLPASILQKACELLALVLLAPQRRVQREIAAAALWPRLAGESSRKAVRQALWQLHQVIDQGSRSQSSIKERLVISDSDVIAVNPDRQLWVDYTVFSEAAAEPRWNSSATATATDAEVAELCQATALYRGPLLAGCYEDWCHGLRAHLEDRQITLLDRLSVAPERRSELEPAISCAQRLLEIESAHERTHRRLMHLYHQNDDRTRALRQYARCREVLDRELGVRPSLRTERLAASISHETRRPSQPEPGTGDFEQLRLELAALRRSVDAIRDELRGDVT